MKAQKKEKDCFDIVITMSGKEAKTILDAIGEKSEQDDIIYYQNPKIHSVFAELYDKLNLILTKE